MSKSDTRTTAIKGALAQLTTDERTLGRAKEHARLMIVAYYSDDGRCEGYDVTKLTPQQGWWVKVRVARQIFLATQGNIPEDVALFGRRQDWFVAATGDPYRAIKARAKSLLVGDTELDPFQREAALARVEWYMLPADTSEPQPNE